MDQRETFLHLRKQVMEKEFARMNPVQCKAVFAVRGPLLILAGAGSGKTTVLVNRIANLIRYGNAYASDIMPEGIRELDLMQMRAALEGVGEIDETLQRKLAVQPAQPWQILAITFTNKAAGELKRRLEVVLGTGALDIWACTFHSACARILRRDGDRLGFTRNFTIYDTDDSRRLMKECQKLLEIDDKILPHRSILNEISRAKDRLQSPESYRQTAGSDYRLKQIAAAYELYQKMLKRADALDFDDLIFATIHLLQTNPDVLERYQHQFQYVMVDEYQDTNHSQHTLTTLLAGQYRNICVVGDDDQSIYRFRGATIENILGFEKVYPEAEVIRLEQNYRSTKSILGAANAVIANNTQRKGKSLWTQNQEGELITVFLAEDEQGEASFVGDTVMERVKEGAAFRDHAVLYRMNAQSNAVERTLVKMGIPYRIIGGHRFYERKEIRDAIAYLTVLHNPHDNIRLQRIINEPKRGIGDTTISHAMDIAESLGLSLFEVIRTADEYAKLRGRSEKLMQFAGMILHWQEEAENASLHKTLETVMQESGYRLALSQDLEKGQERLENLAELASNLITYEEENEEATLSGFLEEVALMTDIDNYDASADSVTLMTLHAAKGLEFPVVFMVGMEEGIFPGMQTLFAESEEEMEEERRLAYVGITRAEKKLFLLHAHRRLLYGATKFNRPSRFIEEIPDPFLDRRTAVKPAFVAPTQKAPAPKSTAYQIGVLGTAAPKKQEAYHPGDTVLHNVFGKGIVLSTKPMGNDNLLEIAFDKVGTKRIMANFAKLQRADAEM